MSRDLDHWRYPDKDGCHPECPACREDDIMEPPAYIAETAHDLILIGGSCWISVDGFTVWVRKIANGSGVQCEIFEAEKVADGEPLDIASAIKEEKCRKK